MKNKFFKKYVDYRMPRAFGVDFNNNSIKVLQLNNRGKKCQVGGYGKKNLPKGVIQNYEISDKTQFADIFRSAISEASGKIKGTAAIVALPENKVFIRMISIPTLTQKELSETIKWETESNIPISIEEVYFDWQVVKKDKENMKVLVVACPRKIIDNYMGVFDAMGFEVLVFEPESIASGRCAINAKEESPVMLVDIGLGGTSISIYENGFPVFTSGSSFSGAMITDIISKEMGINSEKAEVLKMKIGMGSNIKEKQELEKILQPSVAGFVSEIERTLIFFTEKLSQNNQQKINRIILSGGGSNLKGLSSYLAIKLRTQVVLANPWENFNFGGKLPKIPKDEAESFVTAIGLAIRASCYEDYN